MTDLERLKRLVISQRELVRKFERETGLKHSVHHAYLKGWNQEYRRLRRAAR